MEQVEGGDLIINRGVESKPKESAAGTPRDFNSVEGYDAAIKLAQVRGQCQEMCTRDSLFRPGKYR